MKEQLKNIALFKYGVLLARTLRVKPSRAARVRAFEKFLRSYEAFLRLPQNPRFAALRRDLYPRLFDDTAVTHVDPVYFYQNAWTAKKIFVARPAQHVDVASAVPLVSILSQFVPTTMVDLRPLPVALEGLSFVEGNITALPFEDGSIRSLSSICVIEHIGLGRYGDPLDPMGSEKAAVELTRVLAAGGDLYVTVPVDTRDAIFFNAHRTFTRDGALALFPDLDLVEEAYQYGNSMAPTYDPARGFGTGMYHFRKHA